MNRETRSAFRLYVLYFFMAVSVMILEYSQVSEDIKIYFVLTKLFTIILIFIALLILLKFREYSKYAHTVLVVGAMAYPALGELFRPTYEYALMPLFITLAMFAPISKRYLYLAMILSTSAFCIVYFYTYQRNLILVAEMNVFDNIWTFVLYTFVGCVTAHNLTSEKDLRFKAQARYSLIGTHASAILHDLKNILSTPLLQIDELRLATKDQKNRNIDIAISDIEKNLSHAASMAMRFNQMAVLANTDKSKVKISDTLLEVKAILNRRLNGVIVDIQGDHEILADQGFITSLFLNLFMNSLSAMMQSDYKKIVIIINSKRIIFQDFGSGFSSEALKHINKSLNFSDKEGGSGNGLRIINEACLDLGAKVSFYNNTNGACVEISI